MAVGVDVMASISPRGFLEAGMAAECIFPIA